MAVVKDFNGNKLTFQGSKNLSDVVQCPTKFLIRLDNINCWQTFCLVKEPKQPLLRFKILISRCENCRRIDFPRRKYDVFENLISNKIKVQKH